jgi:hypothetical protein
VPSTRYRTEGQISDNELKSIFATSSDGKALEIIPDDHPVFSGLETLLKPENLVENMTKTELSQFNRLNEKQKDAFLEERKAEYERQVRILKSCSI